MLMKLLADDRCRSNTPQVFAFFPCVTLQLQWVSMLLTLKYYGVQCYLCLIPYHWLVTTLVCQVSVRSCLRLLRDCPLLTHEPADRPDSVVSIKFRYTNTTEGMAQNVSNLPTCGITTSSDGRSLRKNKVVTSSGETLAQPLAANWCLTLPQLAGDYVV